MIWSLDLMVGINITGIGWVTAAGMGRGREHESFAMPRGGYCPKLMPQICLKGLIRISGEWMNIPGWD